MRRRIATALAVLSPTLGLLAAAPVAAQAPEPPGAARAAAAPGDRSVRLDRWSSGAQWRQGTLRGLRVEDGGLTFETPAGRRTYAGRSYDTARWISPWTATGFGFDELIASWSARTPGDSLLEISVRGRSGAGAVTSWDTLARWAAGDRHVKRTSVSGQDDDGTEVAVDTWRASGLAAFQVRVSLLRRTGRTAEPSIGAASVMTSRVPASAGPTSAPGPARGTVLRVPRYSQMVHRGHYPQWGSGGEAWCSPTATSMVLGYYGALPPARSYGWVPDGHVDPWVDHGARMTYDYAYDGTGNWPFNTAYAAQRTRDAFVTRLRSLREAELFVAAGIPLVVSIAFGPGELDNAPIGSSNGHLLVIAGFRDNGDVVVNDPASSNRRGVRRTYDRGQLEKIWLEASGGLTYVVRDAAHPLPPGAHSNW